METASRVTRPCRHSLLLLALFVLVLLPGAPEAAASRSRATAPRGTPAPNGAQFEYVIHISVDGLRPGAVTTLGPALAPHFYRMRIEGAFTDNARSDYDITVTLPNHACQLTSRPVYGDDGHGLYFNYDDGRALEQIHGSYVAGVFDVVHDNGLGTGMYTSKSKFALFDRSWNEMNGAPDTVGVDNGGDKIDLYVIDWSTPSLTNTFIANMSAAPHRYAFFHFNDLDAAGHAYGWESNEYYASLREVDRLVGLMFDLVDDDPALAGKTAIVLVADHGGFGTDHSNAALPQNYTVPLYAWGPGIPAGADVYRLNQSIRLDPGTGRPTYAAESQPIRNGEAANLALDLLGLGPIPGSSIDAAQNLAVSLPGGAGALPAVSITSPMDGALFVFPAAVTIDVAADPGTGSLTMVELFDNYILVGGDTEYPYSWTFWGLPVGEHHFTARANRDDGISNTSSVEVEMTSATSVLGGHSLRTLPPRIFPNPADRSTSVEFFLEERGAVEITIYDLLGRRLRTVFGGELDGGIHTFPLDAKGLSPGLYFVKLHEGGDVRTGKLLVIR